MIGGFLPVADARDIAAGLYHMARGRSGALTEVGLAMVGAVPLIGDAGKVLLKHGDEALDAARGAEEAATKSIHKNSLDYVGDTHVYVIRGPDGSLHKVGESAQGVRVGDGASIRGEAQARQLRKETGEFYISEIRQNFPDKASARAYETKLIERLRSRYSSDALPGNKTNR